MIEVERIIKVIENYYWFALKALNCDIDRSYQGLDSFKVLMCVEGIGN